VFRVFPRGCAFDLQTVFKTGTFGHSVTPPHFLYPIILWKISAPTLGPTLPDSAVIPLRRSMPPSRFGEPDYGDYQRTARHHGRYCGPSGDVVRYHKNPSRL